MGKTKFMMMIGLVGSGKSYFAEILSDDFDTEIISSDSVRKEMFGDENTQGDNAEIFKHVHEKVLSLLKSGRNVILDATNVSYKYRMHLLQKMNKFDVEKIAYLVATPYGDCVENNERRERVVPEHVIKKMRERFTVPFYKEGWDDIQIIWNIRGELPRPIELFNYLRGFEQNNPNHSLTLGEHCLSAYRSIRDFDEDVSVVVSLAMLYHDVGKVQTKVFHNYKGDPTDIAHYYSHENVGAYETLFYQKADAQDDDTILEVCKLIQFHMRIYFAKTDKAKKKLRCLVGDEDYKNLQLINKADRGAH